MTGSYAEQREQIEKAKKEKAMNKGLLESDGSTSSTRVAMFLCVLTGCAVAVLGVWRGLDLVGLATLSTGLVSAGMGFKVWQKSKEQP